MAWLTGDRSFGVLFDDGRSFARRAGPRGCHMRALFATTARARRPRPTRRAKQGRSVSTAVAHDIQSQEGGGIDNARTAHLQRIVFSVAREHLADEWKEGLGVEDDPTLLTYDVRFA